MPWSRVVSGIIGILIALVMFVLGVVFYRWFWRDYLSRATGVFSACQGQRNCPSNKEHIGRNASPVADIQYFTHAGRRGVSRRWNIHLLLSSIPAQICHNRRYFYVHHGIVLRRLSAKLLGSPAITGPVRCQQYSV